MSHKVVIDVDIEDNYIINEVERIIQEMEGDGAVVINNTDHPRFHVGGPEDVDVTGAPLSSSISGAGAVVDVGGPEAADVTLGDPPAKRPKRNKRILGASIQFNDTGSIKEIKVKEERKRSYSFKDHLPQLSRMIVCDILKIKRHLWRVNTDDQPANTRRRDGRYYYYSSCDKHVTFTSKSSRDKVRSVHLFIPFPFSSPSLISFGYHQKLFYSLFPS